LARVAGEEGDGRCERAGDDNEVVQVPANPEEAVTETSDPDDDVDGIEARETEEDVVCPRKSQLRDGVGEEGDALRASSATLVVSD
jgi:hypothetical protein